MVVITPIELQTSKGMTSGPAGKVTRFARQFIVSGKTALVAADVLAFSLSLGVAVLAANRLEPGALQSGDVGLLFWVTIGLIVTLMLSFSAWGHYDWRPFRSGEIRTVALASLAALLGTGFLAYMLRLDAGRVLPLVMWSLSAAAVLAARSLTRTALHKAGAWQRQAVLVGYGDTATEAMRLLLDGAGRDYVVAGVLHPSRIGPMQHGRWSGVLRQHQADLVVLAMDDPPREMTDWLMRDGVPYAVVPRPDGLPVLGSTRARQLSHDAVLWSYRNNLQQPAARTAKLAIDVAGALAMIVALAPVLVLIAAAIKLDGGNVLYAHHRVGVGGRSFPCLKFRSMVRDSDAVLAHVLSTDPVAAAEWAATRKLRRDPRVTWIGRFLRQTSLDELPQLFNVLRLDMSLVGPRPIVTAEVPRYGEDIHYYYAARPGLTGLWQVSGRSDTGYTQRVRLDTWYVKNWSFWNDLAILAKTVPAVLKRRGAV